MIDLLFSPITIYMYLNLDNLKIKQVQFYEANGHSGRRTGSLFGFDLGRVGTGLAQSPSTGTGPDQSNGFRADPKLGRVSDYILRIFGPNPGILLARKLNGFYFKARSLT